MKIFILDTNTVSLNNLTNMLREAIPGCRIEGFINDGTFLQALQSDHADIYFITPVDEENNCQNQGCEKIANQIKELHKKLNLIVTSKTKSCLDKAMELHASDYIIKPVTQEKLKRALGNLRYSIDDAKPLIRIKILLCSSTTKQSTFTEKRVQNSWQYS